MLRPADFFVRVSVTSSIKTVIACGVLGVATLLSLERVGGQEKDKPAKDKSKANTAAQKLPELTADLDEAIRMIEENEFRAFVERYAPVELLRTIRQQGRVERFSKSFSTQPKAKEQLLTFVKSVRKLAPNVNSSSGLATIQIVDEENADSESSELHLPNTDKLKLTGLGSDLKKALAEASQLLTKGEIQTFIERLFPASELARLQDPGAMEDLIQQFNFPIEASLIVQSQLAKNPGNATLLKAWQADLATLQTLKPELNDAGQTADFRVESKDKQSERIIRFQKKDGDWRLYDDYQSVSDELTKQSKLQARSVVNTVHMELIGGNWRFMELPIASK